MLSHEPCPHSTLIICTHLMTDEGKHYAVHSLGQHTKLWLFYNFIQITHKRHPIIHQGGWDMGCLLWVQSLVYFLPRSLQGCAQHPAKLLQWCNNEHNGISNHRCVECDNEHDGISNHQCVNVSSTVCSGADQRKHQRSASLAFVRGNHQWPMDSPHKGLVKVKMLPFDYIIVEHCQ